MQMQQQQVKDGEDPKSILCSFFKAGVCEKGKKCKFSHDLGLEGKSAKIDIYSDPRDKAGKTPPERTDIICTHFLDAVEKNLYGWLWECPNNGDKCTYRHALPPGFVLEREKKELEKAKLAAEDDDDELTVEEKIEEERAKLPNEGLTPVTLETFLAWKQRKAERKQKELEEKMKEEAKKNASSKGTNVLSGRALFKYDPNLFQDDEDAAAGDIYEERNEEEEEEKKQGEVDGQVDQGDDEDGETEDKSKPIGMIKAGGGGGASATVDTDLFAQEQAGADEEEPEFD